MSFANLGPLWTMLGLFALAGALFLLQRLRVRHRPVEVETMLFWQQAVEQSRARVLVQRFRHPWAFALVVVIASALWLAFAGLRSAGADRRDHLVLLDASAAMARGERFANAKQLAIDYAAQLPEGARRVVLCGGRARTLLRAGEPAALLRHRLAGVSAEACPNSIADALHGFVRAAAMRPLSVCVVGDAWLTQIEAAALPDSVQVRELKVDGGGGGSNRGITALGVRAAIGGSWEQVDVLVDVLGGEVAPQLALDDQALVARSERSRLPDGTVRHRYRLVANGQTLTVSLPAGDANPLDDRATFVLPDRRAIPIAIGPGVPDLVRRVVAADPGFVVQQQNARVAIRVANSAFAGDLPAIELSDAASAEDAFLVFHSPDDDPNAVLEELYVGLGLHEIDAMATAEAIGRTITMGARPGAQKALWLWRELLDERYDFVHSRSFPLFVGLGLRWLAEFDEGPVRVAVGEPVAIRDATVTHQGRARRSFGGSYVPSAVGTFRLAAGGAFAASLLDPAASGAARADLAELGAATSGSAGFDWVTLLLSVALLLLVVEWALYRTSRMP